MYPSCQPVVNKYKQIQGQHARFGHCHIVILQGSYGIYRRPPATLCHSNHPQVVTTLKKVGWFQPSQMIYRFVIGLPTFSNFLLLVVCMTQAHDRLHVSDRGLASLAATHFQRLPNRTLNCGWFITLGLPHCIIRIVVVHITYPYISSSDSRLRNHDAISKGRHSINDIGFI